MSQATTYRVPRRFIMPPEEPRPYGLFVLSFAAHVLVFSGAMVLSTFLSSRTDQSKVYIVNLVPPAVSQGSPAARVSPSPPSAVARPTPPTPPAPPAPKVEERTPPKPEVTPPREALPPPRETPPPRPERSPEPPAPRA